ncbi:DUF3798 domain-containing protein [Peptacetobacter sp.]|uniref:DUF3798 domain-containing protein n=1 Tax=Peptacetobacter sp. TaxID=2991975 RepID=UPI00260EA18F|nr:DUF3798 domain-containing protein [Peptacetobacter sp.]
MLKKTIVRIISFCMIVGMAGCSKNDKKNTANLTDSYAQIMLVRPESVKLEKNFLEGNSKVKEVILPKNYDKNIEKTIEEIASFADNDKVKSIIICSDKDGLLPVFSKINKKNDSIMTVAAGIEEMQNKEKRNEVETDEFVTMGFNPTDTDNNINAIRMAKIMGSKVFVNYLDSFSENDIELQNKNKDMQSECNRNNLKYIEVKIPNMKNEDDYKTALEFIKKDAIEKKKTYGEDVSLYGSRDIMDRGCIEAALENRLMVPNIHSIDSTKLYSDILDINIKSSESDDYKKINDEISKKLKSLNMEARLAGTEIPEKTFCVEVAVDTMTRLFSEKTDEAIVFGEMQKNIKEKTGILAEYKKVRYDKNFFKVVEMYPILY